jgi:hypothetical protein
MIKEGIEKLEGLIRDSYVVNAEGRSYSAKALTPVLFEPLPDTIRVHNLRGFCGFIGNDIDRRIDKAASLIFVENSKRVTLLSDLRGEGLRREELVEAVLDDGLRTFPFGKFLPQEEFAVNFRSLFVRKEGDDFDYVLSFTSKLTHSDSISTEDDGISQKVQVRKGASGVLSEGVTLKPVVRLSPYRTFREVEQPESEFLLRVSDHQGTPVAALFEADGGAWINRATENIVGYIQSQITDIPVIA